MESPNDGDSSSGTSDNETRRGINVLKKVTRARKKGTIFTVGWNRRGQPVNPNKKDFVNYIGMVTRMIVPISYNHWGNVPGGMKKDIWDDVKKSFDIGDVRKTYVLQEAGNLLRNFRTKMRKRIKNRKGKNRDIPPKKYKDLISEIDWRQFVAHNSTEDFQRESQANRQRALNPVYPYRKGCLGYAILEQQMIEDAGSDITSIPRHVLWRIAHQSKKGVIDNDNVLQVLEQCDNLSQSLSQEEIQYCGRDDLLSKALKAPEHPGRVRAAGFGVSQRVYFDSRMRPQEHDSESVKQMRQELDVLRNLVHDLVKKGHPQEKTDMQPDDLPFYSGESSRPPSPVILPEVILPEGINACVLYLATPTHRKVANGTLYNNPIETLHSCSLPPEHVKVSVDFVIEGEESAHIPIPIEDGNVFTVGDAIGTFVAWPKILVSTMTPAPSIGKHKATWQKKEAKAVQAKKTAEPAKNHVEPAKTHVGQAKKTVEPAKKTVELGKKTTEPTKKLEIRPGGVDKLQNCKFVWAYARRVLTSGNVLRIYMEPNIFNCEYHESIGEENVAEIYRHSKLSASSICVYMRFLYYEVLVPNQLTEKYSFLCPHQLGTYKCCRQSQYIADALIANDHTNRVFLAPYNCGDHWVLLVINSSEIGMEYFDSLGGDPTRDTHLKNMFEAAFAIYHAYGKDELSKKKLKAIEWRKIKCAQQTNGVDCGYYVLKYMRDMILLGNSETLQKDVYNNECSDFFSKEEVDEIREEWSSYVFRNFIIGG